MSEQDLGHIKGNVVRQFYEWFAGVYGEERARAAINALESHYRQHFRVDAPGAGILPSAWYPTIVVHRMLDLFTEGMSEQQLEELTEQAGEALVDGLLRGLQGALFRLFVTPDRYAKHIQRSWDINYDNGRVDLIKISPTCHESTLTDWKGHHPLLCRLNGAVRLAIYRHMRISNVQRSDRQCISLGDPICGSRVSWTP